MISSQRVLGSRCSPHIRISVSSLFRRADIFDAFMLVRPNEITPGISAEEYEQRRKALMERLPEDSLVVSVSAEMKYMSGRKSPRKYAAAH